MEQHACTSLNRTVYDELLSVFQPLIDMEKDLEELPKQIENATDDIHSLIEKQDLLLQKFQDNGGLTYKSRTRSSLIGLGFTEEDFTMEVSKLSGGQKVNLALQNYCFQVLIFFYLMNLPTTLTLMQYLGLKTF